MITCGGWGFQLKDSPGLLLKVDSSEDGSPRSAPVKQRAQRSPTEVWSRRDSVSIPRPAVVCMLSCSHHSHLPLRRDIPPCGHPSLASLSLSPYQHLLAPPHSWPAGLPLSTQKTAWTSGCVPCCPPTLASVVRSVGSQTTAA